MKKLILFIVLLNTSILIAQSKKEQIETLNLRIDSLNSLIYLERNTTSQNILNFNLQNIYPTAEIRNVATTPHSGDFWLIRKDKPVIIVENKNYETKVYTGEVQKFIDDMNEHNLCGIMISQKTKIVYRNN